MTVKELIEYLEECENKDIDVICESKNKIFNVVDVKRVEHIDLLCDENCEEFISISIHKCK